MALAGPVRLRGNLSATQLLLWLLSQVAREHDRPTVAIGERRIKSDQVIKAKIKSPPAPEPVVAGCWVALEWGEFL